MAPPGRALTSAETASSDPSVTPDGRVLAYTVTRPGGASGRELHVRDLASGDDRLLGITDTARGESRGQPAISPDGRRLAIRYSPSGGGVASGRQQLRQMDLQTDEETNLTREATGLIVVFGWSSDSEHVVATLPAQRERADGRGSLIALLPLSAAPDAEARMRIVTSREDGALFQANMSPNGRWMAFVASGGGVFFRIAVVGSSDGRWAEPKGQSAWRYIDDDTASQDKPRWSHDGRVLYYTSSRGGLLNVWGVPFDPQTGVIGAPFQVTNFDGPGERIFAALAAMETAVSRDALFLPLVRPTGAVWLAGAGRSEEP